MPTLVPAELDNWMQDLQVELQSAMNLGDQRRVVDVSTKLAEGASQMVYLTRGGMACGLPDCLQKDLLPGSGESGGGSETTTARTPESKIHSIGGTNRATKQTVGVGFIHASGPSAACSA